VVTALKMMTMATPTLMEHYDFIAFYRVLKTDELARKYL